MAQVHGNPEELRDFARELGSFCDETRERLGALQSRLHNMGESSWTDARYQEFNDALERAGSSIRLALDDLEPEQVQRLYALANILEEYQQA